MNEMRRRKILKVEILEIFPSFIKSLLLNIRLFGICRGIRIPLLIS